ncbi:DoxX family protein, partial [Pedobacter lusitanus]|uniref:DoxX family protein n=1 Tax=Pedobacter lusitanus TaxID=1503925 RepID=UPI0005A47D51
MALQGTQHLGLPYWFHVEAGIGSFIGGLILIIPKLPSRLKEWAYVALGITYISALIAHLYVDGVVPMSFMPIVVFAVLLISYLCYHKLLKYANP